MIDADALQLFGEVADNVGNALSLVMGREPRMKASYGVRIRLGDWPNEPLLGVAPLTS